MNKWKLIVVLSVLTGSIIIYANKGKVASCHSEASVLDKVRYERFEMSKALMKMPEMNLVSQNEKETSLAAIMGTEKPVFLQFIFTSCPTICPILSSHFASFQELVASSNEDVLMLSISIDPDYDTPERLSEYADTYDARPFWTFYTGEKRDIEKLQAAFKNYQDNKMDHRPVTYYRDPSSDTWYAFEGFITGDDLRAEYKQQG